MKLFYSSGSCSLASHIMLEEANAQFEVQQVNLGTGEQRQPAYLKVNPKGKVPALAVDGYVLTENPAIISYIADTHPEAGLLAAPGSLERAKAQEWLAWCASGMHRNFGPLFASAHGKNAPDPSAKATVQANYETFDQQLADRRFILGDQFSAADGYTLVFTLWAKGFELKLGDHMKASARALLERAGVKRAVATQGLKFDFLG